MYWILIYILITSLISSYFSSFQTLSKTLNFLSKIKKKNYLKQIQKGWTFRTCLILKNGHLAFITHYSLLKLYFFTHSKKNSFGFNTQSHISPF